MKSIKKKFNRGTVLILISINWAVVALLISHFVGNTQTFTPILWTLLIAFMLQLGFLSDQLKGINSQTTILK